jgi:hypothetical protein
MHLNDFGCPGIVLFCFALFVVFINGVYGWMYGIFTVYCLQKQRADGASGMPVTANHCHSRHELRVMKQEAQPLSWL